MRDYDKYTPKEREQRAAPKSCRRCHHMDHFHTGNHTGEAGCSLRACPCQRFVWPRIPLGASYDPAEAQVKPAEYDDLTAARAKADPHTHSNPSRGRR